MAIKWPSNNGLIKFFWNIKMDYINYYIIKTIIKLKDYTI